MCIGMYISMHIPFGYYFHPRFSFAPAGYLGFQASEFSKTE